MTTNPKRTSQTPAPLQPADEGRKPSSDAHRILTKVETLGAVHGTEDTSRQSQGRGK